VHLIHVTWKTKYGIILRDNKKNRTLLAKRKNRMLFLLVAKRKNRTLLAMRSASYSCNMEDKIWHYFEGQQEE
jgi:hypothetical protein